MTDKDAPTVATGPLRPHPPNPRYFADAAGRAVYLTGAHTWNNLQDFSPGPTFDYPRYLGFMGENGFNFMRLWHFEHAKEALWSDPNPQCAIGPLPFARSGPGKAADGLAKFDLALFNDEYFARLRRRAAAAGAAGVYAAVMLFQGFSVEHYEPNSPFRYHPMHRGNNVNGIDGDPGRTGSGRSCHTLELPAITQIQEAYVRKVIEAVGDLPNVLYEITNESSAHSTEWQYHMIRLVKQVEASRPQQHPVGMTYQWEGGTNETLFKSPADWISPNPEGGYGGEAPDPSGEYRGKVVVPDTDHLWGIGGHRRWVWRSFMRGLNPIFMDPYDGTLIRADGSGQWGAVAREEVRTALSQTAAMARRIDLASAQPGGQFASSRFCLAAPGQEYLAYQPASGALAMRLEAGRYAVEWFDPIRSRWTSAGDAVAAAARERFKPPFEGEAVLHLRRKP